MQRFKPIIYFALISALTVTVVFLLNRVQLNIMTDIASSFNQNPSLSPTPDNQTNQSAEIAQLRQEVEELKNQYSQDFKKAELQSAATPASDLKAQEDLDRAKDQAGSLTKQLAELLAKQTQNTTATSDSDMLKSWQADSKVVRVACQDRVLNNWQMGSGVLISGDGKVLTNQHVIQSSLTGLSPDYCLVLFNKDFDAQANGYKAQYRATVSGFFQDRDAALLKITDSFYMDQIGATHITAVKETFSFWPLATNEPQIGDSIYVVGFPESASFTFSVTKGIISNLTTDGLFYGTDAQIDRGNSGGAAVNSAGQLVGLPTWKFVGGGDYRGYILNIQTISLN